MTSKELAWAIYEKQTHSEEELAELVRVARAEAVAEARSAWIAKFGELEKAAHAASEAIDALEQAMRDGARLMGEV